MLLSGVLHVIHIQKRKGGEEEVGGGKRERLEKTGQEEEGAGW